MYFINQGFYALKVEAQTTVLSSYKNDKNE